MSVLLLFFLALRISVDSKDDLRVSFRKALKRVTTIEKGHGNKRMPAFD